jgi:hypothetical protein
LQNFATKVAKVLKRTSEGFFSEEVPPTARLKGIQGSRPEQKRYPNPSCNDARSKGGGVKRAGQQVLFLADARKGPLSREGKWAVN